MKVDRNGARLPAWLDRQSGFNFPGDFVPVGRRKLYSHGKIYEEQSWVSFFFTAWNKQLLPNDASKPQTMLHRPPCTCWSKVWPQWCQQQRTWAQRRPSWWSPAGWLCPPQRSPLASVPELAGHRAHPPLYSAPAPEQSLPGRTPCVSHTHTHTRTRINKWKPGQ